LVLQYSMIFYFDLYKQPRIRLKISLVLLFSAGGGNYTMR